MRICASFIQILRRLRLGMIELVGFDVEHSVFHTVLGSKVSSEKVLKKIEFIITN